MEIKEHERYPTRFILGYRMVEGVPEKIGAVIVKGTFHDIDAPNAAPKEAQEKIFLKDEPFNFVRNSDFAAETPSPWQAVGGTPIQENGMAKLTSQNGKDYLTQNLPFDESIGKQTFVLSFYAKADLPITIGGFQLKAPTSGTNICRVSAALTNELRRFSSSAEAWPPDVIEKSFDVVLSGSGNKDNSVYFDRIQVEKAASKTRWDDDTVFRYEHDLLPFKPNADVIILGAAEPPDGNRSGTWYAVLKSDDGRHVDKEFVATADPEDFPAKTIFGWAVRGKEPRKSEAGDAENFKPETMALPNGFDNRFYNGYDRGLSGNVPLPYLNDGIKLTIRFERRQANPPPPVSFIVQLPASRPSAALTRLDETGQEVVQMIPLVLDTLVIEPNLDRYVVVWRGFWEFDDNIKERYLKLTVTGGV